MFSCYFSSITVSPWSAHLEAAFSTLLDCCDAQNHNPRSASCTPSYHLPLPASSGEWRPSYRRLTKIKTLEPFELSYEPLWKSAGCRRYQSFIRHNLDTKMYQKKKKQTWQSVKAGCAFLSLEQSVLSHNAKTLAVHYVCSIYTQCMWLYSKDYTVYRLFTLCIYIHTLWIYMIHYTDHILYWIYIIYTI